MSDKEIEAKLADAQQMLEALRSGDLHIGAPFESRMEVKISDLQRKIAEYQAILNRGNAEQT